jgi:hypothetical protein
MVNLKAAVKKADVGIRQYVFELERRNEKLLRWIAKLEADKLQLSNTIKALKKERARMKYRAAEGERIDVQHK